MSSSTNNETATCTTLALLHAEAPTKPTIASAWYNDSALVQGIRAVANGTNAELAPLAQVELAKVTQLKAEYKNKEAMLRDIITCRVTMEKVRRCMEQSTQKYGEWPADLIAMADEYAPKRVDHENYQKQAKKRTAEEEATAKSLKKAKTPATKDDDATPVTTSIPMPAALAQKTPEETTKETTEETTKEDE